MRTRIAKVFDWFLVDMRERTIDYEAIFEWIDVLGALDDPKILAANLKNDLPSV